MAKPKNFVIVKNIEENTIDEYRIEFDQKKLDDYTRNLIFPSGNEMVIKRILEASYLKAYVDPKGILSFNKIEYIDNYLNNTTGPYLFGSMAKNRDYDIDYDSKLSTYEKQNIVLQYLNLLEFNLVNQYDLDLINEAYKMFRNMQVTGVFQASTTIENILNVSENVRNIFDTVGFDVRKSSKVMKKEYK